MTKQSTNFNVALTTELSSSIINNQQQQQTQTQPQVSSNMPSINTNMLPEVLKRIVLKAGCEDRLKVGLDSCIESLNTCDPIKILAVILTDNPEDLFSQTILETYCYEQSIPFMKTDLKILRRMLKCIQSGSKDTDPTCMIIMKPQNNLINSDELELVKAINLSEMNNQTLVLLNPPQQQLTPTSPSPQVQWTQTIKIT